MKSKIIAVTAVLLVLFSVLGTGLVLAENAEGEVVTKSVAADAPAIAMPVSADIEVPETAAENEDDETAETADAEKAVTEFKICVPEFVDSLKVMLIGLVGIFAVTGVIILCICLLNKFTAGKEE